MTTTGASPAEAPASAPRAAAGQDGGTRAAASWPPSPGRSPIFVPVFLVATFVTFALRSLSGLSPARIQLGEKATPRRSRGSRAQWGLDRPFLVQYGDWFGGVLHGELGASWINGADISTLIGLGLGVSLSVATFALVIGVVVGFALGTLAALRRTHLGRPRDHRLRHRDLGDAGVRRRHRAGRGLRGRTALCSRRPDTSRRSGGVGPWLAHITCPPSR